MNKSIKEFLKNNHNNNQIIYSKKKLNKIKQN